MPFHTVFLFPSEKTKGALSERMPGYIVKKYADRAKLADVSPHDLRHRFGYRMAESVPLHRLAQIMGYDSPKRFAEAPGLELWGEQTVPFGARWVRDTLAY